MAAAGVCGAVMRNFAAVGGIGGAEGAALRMMAARAQRSLGSKTLLDVLRGRLLRRKRSLSAEPPSQETIDVTCHLRGSVPGLPRRFSYGVLVISPDVLRWRRYIWRADLRDLPPFDSIDEVRAPGGAGERNIKQGLFSIVRASGPLGSAEFGVPRGDVNIVREALMRAPRQHGTQ
jgi:hypothetical protein